MTLVTASQRAQELRIALVNPFDRVDPELPLSPLALGYLASHLEVHGYKCDLFNFEQDPTPPDELVERYRLGGYNLLAFASYTHTFQACLSLVDAIKRHSPQCTVVLGGYHATELSTEVLRDFPQIDLVIRNEGEHPLLALIQALENGGDLANVPNLVYRGPEGQIFNTPCLPIQTDLDSLSYPKREFKNGQLAFPTYYDVRSRRRRSVFHIVSSRGCPYQCNYCSIPVSAGRLMRYRSTENVLEELRVWRARSDFGHVFFSEPNFLVSHKRARELAIAMHAEWPDLTFSFETRSDQIVRFRETIEILSQNGCSAINIGVESGSEAVLKRLNKGTSVAQNELAIEILRNCGIHPLPYMIMFDPEATIADLRDNIDLLKRTGSYTTTPHYSTLYGRLEPLPGVPYRTYYQRKWGLPDVHALAPVLFEDSNVHALYRVVKQFQYRYDHAICDALGFADRLRNALTERVTELEDDIGLLVQVTLLDSVSLVHIPYCFFERLVELFELHPGIERSIETIYPELRLAELEAALARSCAARKRLSALVQAVQFEKPLQSAPVWEKEGIYA
ncbi:radical SAM protein [Rhizobium ruizarguesonis]